MPPVKIKVQVPVPAASRTVFVAVMPAVPPDRNTPLVFVSPVTSSAYVGAVVEPMLVLPAKILVAPVLAL